MSESSSSKSHREWRAWAALLLAVGAAVATIVGFALKTSEVIGGQEVDWTESELGSRYKRAASAEVADEPLSLAFVHNYHSTSRRIVSLSQHTRVSNLPSHTLQGRWDATEGALSLFLMPTTSSLTRLGRAPKEETCSARR